MKTYKAHFRNRMNGELNDYWVDIQANNQKEAKQIAKGYQGKDERMTWFMGLEK